MDEHTADGRDASHERTDSNAADEVGSKGADEVGTNADGYAHLDRRTLLKAAGATASAGIIGATVGSSSATAVTTAAVKPSDGFADVAPWLETEDPTIHRITEATRSAVEAAFTASGPRVVVFETSGVIDLGGETLAITEDKCWVAGQTAPSPGITFIDGMVQVDANDCVVQHVRSRIGPGSDGNIQGNDSFNTADGTTNNVVDHVTASWGTDECMSVGYDTDRTTYSNCMIYEGLWDPYGDGSDHNYATLVGDGASRVALLGNVWAKARSRIPRLKSETESVVANNLAYFFDEGCNMDSSAVTSFVGNTYVGSVAPGDPIVDDGGTAYLADNTTADPALDADTPYAEPSIQRASSRPLWPEGFSPLSSDTVEQHNLANAGARPADRTANDRRIVQEIRDRAGADHADSPRDYWIPDPSAVGGYPDLAENTHSLSVPDSGLRQWLADWAATVEGDGTIETPEPTPTDATPPTAPGNVRVAEQSAYSLDIAWDAASDEGSTGLSHYLVTVDDQTEQVQAGTNTTGISGLSPGTEYDVSVVAVDGAGNESGAATATVTTDAVDEDRTGGVGPIEVSGGGDDIWGDADAFHYYHATTSGDFDVAVRVDALENTDPYAKAGIVARSSLEAGAANVMVRRTPSATSVQWRASAGGRSESLTSSEGQGESEVDGGTTDARWQRLVRSGDTLRAYASTDGHNWTLLADLAVDLGSEVHVGLAACSHAAGTLTTATFDSWSGLSLGESVDVGSVDVAGSVAWPDGTPSGTPSDGPSWPSEPAATDPDGDGHYEDLTGNGEIDNQDVVTFFRNMGTEADPGPMGRDGNLQYYDYSGNEAIDYQDLITLFGQIG